MLYVLSCTSSKTIRSNHNNSDWGREFGVKVCLGLLLGLMLFRFDLMAAPGDVDVTFDIGAGSQGNSTGAINDLAVQPDGKTLIGGVFLTYDGITAPRFARVNTDGTLDTAFMTNVGAGPNSELNSIVLLPDGKILIAGDFTEYNGTAVIGLARVNADGTLDNSFGTVGSGIGFSSGLRYVNDIALQADGKILIGGGFGSINGTGSRNFGRLNGDGTFDNTFSTFARPEVNSSVDAIAVQPDGKIVVTGSFISWGSYSVPNVVRLNPDGTVDTTFLPPIKAAGRINQVTVQHDGKILLGGFIDHDANAETPDRYLARLNADGSLDSSFNANTDGWVGGEIIQQVDGKLLIAGIFTEVNGISRGSVARLNLDGTLDENFVTAPYAPRGDGYLTHVYALAPTPDGKLMAGGWFTNINYLAYSNLVRLQNDVFTGPATIRFQTATYSAAENGGTITLNVVRLGDISSPVSVNFATANGSATAASDYSANSGTLNWSANDSTPKTITISLNNDSSNEGAENFTVTLSSPGGGASLGNPATATVTILDDDSAPVITGQPIGGQVYQTLSYTFRVNVSSVLPVTYQWQFAGEDIPGATGPTYTRSAATTQHSGEYRVKVTNDNGFQISSIAELEVVIPPGTLDTVYPNPTTFAGSSFISGTYLAPDGKLYLAGGFNSLGGSSVPFGLARLAADGSLDTGWPNITTGTDSRTVFKIIPYPSTSTHVGKFLIVGQFNSINGTNARKLARLNADGSLDTTFTSTTPTSSNDIAYSAFIRSDDSIIVSFSNGSIQRRLADGTLDGSFAINLGGTLQHLIPLDGGKFLASRYVSGGSGGGYIYRFNADGTFDTSFNIVEKLSNSIGTMVLARDGGIIVGGSFTSYNGESVSRIARFLPDGTLDSTFNTGTGFDNAVSSIHVQPDGRLIVGGFFTFFNGASASRIIGLKQDGSADPSFYVGSGANNSIRVITQNEHGLTYVMGDFSQFNGNVRNGIARLLGGAGSIQFDSAQIEFSEADGTVNVTVNRLAGSRGAVSATYAVTGGSAAAGSDYTLSSGVLNWADGEIGPKTFSLTINDDTITESDETIQVTLSNPTNLAQLGTPDVATITILDTDSKPRILVHPASQTIPEFVPVTFSVVAKSPLAMTYQWKKNGITIPTATAATYTISSVTFANEDSYTVEVTNTKGTTPSNPALLDVVPSPTALDGSFLATSFNNQIRAIAPLGDGRALVGGDFTSPSSRIALVSANGSLDGSFTQQAGTAAGTTVHDILIQPDGKILIVGKFNQFGGVNVSNIVRLNADFTVDLAFAASLGSGANDLVRDVSLDVSGRILLGGDFTYISGQPGTQGIVRLNPDGSIDPTFISRSRGGAIYQVEAQTDGTILIAGTFTSYDGGASYLARLLNNGAKDSFASADTGSAVYAINILANGDILAGGSFTSPSTRQRIALLDSARKLKSAFFPGSTVNGNVNTVALQPNGKLVAGGAFTTFSSTQNRFARLNPDGTLDTTLNLGTGFNADVNRIVVEPNGRLWVGGNFTQYKGSTANRLVRLYGDDVPLAIRRHPYATKANAGATAQFNVIAESTIGTITYQWKKNGSPLSNGGDISGANTATLSIANAEPADSDVYSVTVSVGGTSLESRAASLSVYADLTLVESPQSGVRFVGVPFTLKAAFTGPSPISYQWYHNESPVGGNQPYLTISNPTLTDVGDYYVVASSGGDDVTSATATISIVQPPSGNDPAGFPLVAGAGNQDIRAIDFMPDGRIIVAGGFTSLRDKNSSTSSRAYMGIFNADGSLDSFNAAANNVIYDILRQPDGKILVAGQFTSISSTTVTRLVRYNANLTLDTAFIANLGTVDGTVNDVELFPDGRILVSGGFTSIGGVTGTRAIAILNSDGSVDTSFVSLAPQFASVTTCAISPTGIIAIGGISQYAGSNGQLFLLNQDGTRVNGFALPNLDNSVGAVEFQADGRLLVGGSFTAVNSTPQSSLCRFNLDGTLDTAFAPNATVFGSTSSQRVSSIAIQADGSILAAGDFIFFGGAGAGLVKVLANGVIDTTFNQGPGIEGNGRRSEIVRLAADGTIYLGGSFQKFGGVDVYNFAVLHGTPVGLAFVVPQPSLVIADPATTVQFTAYATGTSAISYQWQKNGDDLANDANISGVNTATLTLNNVSAANDGNYTVVISNDSGNKTSNETRLIVLDAPVILKQPVGGLYFAPNSITLKVDAVGLPTLTYQWKKNGDDLPSENGATLTISPSSPDNSGSYTVVITNDEGFVESDPVDLNVIVPPAGSVSGFPITAGANSTLNTVFGLEDGRVIISGNSFTSAGATGNNTSRSRMALLNLDGTADASFNPAPSAGASAIVSGGSSSTIVVGGNFNFIAGQTAYGLARLNLDGTIDATFAANLGSGFKYFNSTPNIYDVQRLSNGQYLVAGAFDTVNGNNIRGLARINANGTVDTSFVPFNSGFPFVYDVKVLPDGRYAIAGSFTLGTSQGLAIISSSGVRDAGFTANFSGSVEHLAVTHDNELLVAGQFLSNLNGIGYGNLVKLSYTGTVNTSFAASVGVVSDSVYGIAVQANGRILVGGSFSTFGSSSARGFVRLNGNGSVDTTFTLGTGFNSGGAQSFHIGIDGKILVGSSGASFNGETVNYLLYLNGDEVAAPAGLDFATFIAGSSLTTGQNGPADDGDEDGLSNIGEFAFGTVPDNDASFSWPVLVIVNDGGTDYPAVRYQRNKLATGITIVVTAASDVTMLNTLSKTVMPPVDLGGDLEQVTVRINTSAATTPKVFFHVTITQP